MIIGHFTYSKTQDRYTGELATLTGSRKLVLQPSEATAEKAPQYRVIGESNAGDIEVGGAWKSRNKDGVDYLSVKLDDPMLATPINGALMASTDGESFILVWSRDSRKAKSDQAE